MAWWGKSVTTRPVGDSKRYFFYGKKVVIRYIATPSFKGRKPEIEYVEDVVEYVLLATEETTHAYELGDHVQLCGKDVSIRAIRRAPELGGFFVETNYYVSRNHDDESRIRAEEQLAKYNEKYIEEVKKSL